MSPAFQLPFKCQQEWRATTYDPGHSPNANSTDWKRLSESANVSADEPVIASAAGVVEEAYDTNLESPPYGSVVTIRHDAAWQTQYVHLDDALSVKEGDEVYGGQQIGVVGGNIEIFKEDNNAHLHYVQLKEGTGVRQTFNGVEIDVHAGAKKADGSFPSQTVASANCPVLRTAAGIARSGDWASSFWVSADRASFEKTAQDLFDKKGRRLIHVSTYPEGKARRWVGIARSGDWASSFWVSRTLESLQWKAQKLFDESGRRLVCVAFDSD
jgi:murein DD-endopeptidase MepM/ murein hydrolase activator NlpD